MESGESVACPICRRNNPSSATVCSACGGPLFASGSLSDPDANLVAGAPVPASEREAGHGYASPPDRIARIAPEIASLVSEVITQRANEISDRVSRRSGDVGNRVARRSSDWAERVAERSERLAERLARRAGREPWPAAGERWLHLVAAPRPRHPVPYGASRQDVPVPARAAWFLVAGSWMSCLWVLATWAVLCLFVFPRQANRMITTIPNVLTLRTAVDPPLSIVPYAGSGAPGTVSSARLLYMLFVGWWMSLAWMMIAWALSLTVVGIPVSYRMYAVAPTIAHL
jgi:uncharacterized membrane protein YccF (DUF307 family)